MTALYLPDGSKVLVPDADVAAVLSSTPDLQRVASWTSPPSGVGMSRRRATDRFGRCLGIALERDVRGRANPLGNRKIVVAAVCLVGVRRPGRNQRPWARFLSFCSRSLPRQLDSGR